MKKIFISLLILFSVVGECKLIQQLELKKDKLANVLIFVSKDCPCSNANLSYVNKLVDEFNDFNFIAVHSKKNTTDSQLQDYLKNNQVAFDLINDADLKIADTYQALKTPHAFILTKEKVVYNGGITNTTNPKNAKMFYLKEALEDIRNGRAPIKAETRTLGCFIAR